MRETSSGLVSKLIKLRSNFLASPLKLYSLVYLGKKVYARNVSAVNPLLRTRIAAFWYPYTNTNKEKIGSFFPALWLM